MAEAERAGADRIHVDVMDGHFVPNLSMGAPIIRSLRRATRLPLEAHLMISNPDFFVDEFSIACPVEALRTWRNAAGITGPLFRLIRRGGKVGDRLTDQSIADIVKAHAERVGLDPKLFAGHSLRAESACRSVPKRAGTSTVTR